MPPNYTRNYKMFQAPLNFATLIYQAQISLGLVPSGNAPGFNAVIWGLTVAAMLLPHGLLCLGGLKALSGQRRNTVVVIHGVPLSCSSLRS